MKVAKFAASYLRQYRRLIMILCLFAIIFAVVTSLYRLEVEAVFYTCLLCAAIGLIALGIDFALLYKRHRRLTEFYEIPLIDPRDLPAPSKLIEQDYAALIEILHTEKQKIITMFDGSRRDMEEYYL